jgi:uncharacterized protein (UPF0335 family)
MTKDKIEQKTITWQEQLKKHLNRIGHLELIIGQLKEEVGHNEALPVEVNNLLHNAIDQIEAVRKEIKFIIDLQQDVLSQEQSKPLIIKKRVK